MAEVTRDDIQLSAGYAWYSSNRKNTVIAGTGVGKSKIAMGILDRLYQAKLLNSNSRILLLVDSEHLRDTNWKEDFEKWGYSHIYENMMTECYQTVYKWTNNYFDFVIADEIDFAMTDEYSKFFTQNSYGMLLGLTGFVDKSKTDLLNSIAPPVMVYSTQKAQEEGILNKTQLVIVEYHLSTDPNDLTVEWKDKDGNQKSFTQSENDAYAYIDNRCNVLHGKITKIQEDPAYAMFGDEALTRELKSLKYQRDKAVRDRSSLLCKNKAGAKVARQVVDRVLESAGNKVLIFSMYTDQSDKITKFTYNGKNKDKSGLSKLSSGEIRELGVCKAVNRGVNLDGVNNIVMESYNSSKTQFQQRHGRGCRLHPDQKMFLYVLVPYFMKKVKGTDPGTEHKTVLVTRPTQGVKWATEMMNGYNFPNPIKIYLKPDD